VLTCIEKPIIDKLKIIDFNICKRKNISYDKYSKRNIKLMTHIGTLEYSAPEMLEGYIEYSEQIDMWSAGIILYFMFTADTPFKGDKYIYIII
jgi:serine/threonine protein kinase